MKSKQIGLLVAVLAVVALVIVAKMGKSGKSTDVPTAPVAPAVTESVPAQGDPRPGDVRPTPESAKPSATGQTKALGDGRPAPEHKSLPKVLDLGSVGCIPCEKMKPILAELKTELKGKVDVQFIDIAQDAAAADKYGVQTIPTQIFFDASGKEVTRHIGFMPKIDILAQLEQMGVKGLQ